MIIAKNIGLRKIFLNKNLHEILVRNSLAFLDQRPSVRVSAQMLEVYQNAIKLLCMVCTARKTQFYIPGETNLSERLRKRAFDSGTFTLLTYLYNQLKDVQDNPFKAIREHIQQQILNYETMTDLVYHSKLLTYIRDNPQLITEAQHQIEESKELSQSALAGSAESAEDAGIAVTADSNDPVNNTLSLASPKSKDAINVPTERHSSSKHLSSLTTNNYQTSPRLGTSKGRSVKKTNSSMMNFAS